MKINISREGRKSINLDTVGIFLHDDCALDGGLYAELIENRNFESKNGSGVAAWTPYPEGAAVEMKLRYDRPLYAENPHYLRLRTSAGGTGIQNNVYGGLFLNAGIKYDFSFYARSYDFKGKITVGIYKDGAAVLEKKFKVKPDGKWHRHAFRFKARSAVEKAELAVILSGAGTVHLDCFSMLPDNTIKGVFRRDLAELFKNLCPAYVRFSAGIVGSDGYWKETLTDAARRKHSTGGNSHGIGLYEFFLLCEYVGAKTLPVLRFAPESDVESNFQEVSELIEFATGDSDTEWGSVRSDLGHDEPFRLEYVGIEACPELEKRLHEAYPEIKFITAANEKCLPQGKSWQEALRKAAYMTELEQSGEDLFVYHDAPLGRSGGTDMINLNDGSFFVSADFYVQKMFCWLTGGFALNAESDGENVCISATEREGLTFLKLVNLNEEAVEAEIEGDLGPMTRIVRIEGQAEEFNSVEEPGKVKAIEVAPVAACSLSLPPRSFTVAIFHRG